MTKKEKETDVVELLRQTFHYTRPCTNRRKVLSKDDQVVDLANSGGA